jgi:hypothetical protein
MHILLIKLKRQTAEESRTTRQATLVAMQWTPNISLINLMCRCSNGSLSLNGKWTWNNLYSNFQKNLYFRFKSQALGSSIFVFFNFINKMCIYNVYEPFWYASLFISNGIIYVVDAHFIDKIEENKYPGPKCLWFKYNNGTFIFN